MIKKMSNLVSNEVVHRHYVGTATPGYYAIDKSPIQWMQCRERFNSLWHPEQTRRFFFAHKSDKRDNVIAFIDKTENILEITKTKFYLTNMTNALCIEASQFWIGCHLRRSLLSLLLRVSLEYDKRKDNYEQALFSHQYSMSTKHAIMRFMFGFTNIKAQVGKGGWRDSFENMPREMVRLHLLPDDGEIGNFDDTVLWA